MERACRAKKIKNRDGKEKSYKPPKAGIHVLVGGGAKERGI